MADDNVIMVCPSCGAKNRVPRNRMQDRPICGKCRRPLGGPGGRPVEVSDASFEREVLSAAEPVLVDCWAPWCGPCRMVGPVLDELAREYAGRIKIAKLNVDENQRTAGRYGVQSIPTMLLLKGGKEVNRLVGALPKPQIEQAIRGLL